MKKKLKKKADTFIHHFGEGTVWDLDYGFNIRSISEYCDMNYPTFLFWIFLLTAVLFLNIMYL